jgi:hypothetical protein
VLTLLLAAACASTGGSGALTSNRPVPPAALLAAENEGALGAWYLEHGRDLEEGCRHFEARVDADPLAAFGAFVCADLRVDEARLVELGRSILGRDDLYRWSPARLGYVLVRLGRSPLVASLAVLRQRVLDTAIRTGSVPLEVVVLEHEGEVRAGSWQRTGPFAGPALAGFDRPLLSEGSSPGTLSAGAELLPAWLAPGRYRLRSDEVLEAGTALLAVLRSQNPVRVLGLAEGPLDVNPPGEEPAVVRHLAGHGTGAPLELIVALAVPDPAFSVTLLPAPLRAVPLTCDVASSGALDDWACGWLALASGRFDLAEAALSRHSGPTYRLLLAALRVEHARHDEGARIEALLLLSSALEQAPALALAHLVQARAHERALDVRRALEALERGEACGVASPAWDVARVAAWERASLPAEAERARARLAKRWPTAAAAAASRLPWEPVPAPERPSRGLDEQLRQGVPRAALTSELLRTASLRELPSTLRSLDALEAHELLAVLGERTFWETLRTPLDVVLGASIDEPVSDAPATVLVQEAIVSGRFLYLHRAVRLDSAEGVRRFGEWSPNGSPMLLRARAIKPDHSVVFPETHGSSPLQAFPDLEPGDVIELEWVEELIPAGGPTGAFRTVSLQDRELRVARCCFSVLGPPERRPVVEVETGPLWMFEKTGLQPDGTPYSQWCSRRVPPLPAELDAFQAEAHLTHVTIYPWTDEAEALGRVHDELWRAVRKGPALNAAGADLARRYAGDPEGLARAAFAAVQERLELDVEAPNSLPAEEAWGLRRGSPAAVLIALLRAAGRPARLFLANPLTLERPSSARFNALDFPVAVVAVDVGAGRVAWLDPATRAAPWNWLPAPLRGRPAWSFGFPGAPFRATTPEAAGAPDLLRVELRCERRCDVRVTASGSPRVWLARQVAELGDPEARAEWLRALVSDLIPVEERGVEVRSFAVSDTLRVEGRVSLAPAADGSLRLESPTFVETLLRRHASPSARQWPIYVDADLTLEVSARFDDWRGEAVAPIDEQNTFFAFRRALVTDADGATWSVSFAVHPQIVAADVYAGFRQSLQRIVRPAPIVLSR